MRFNSECWQSSKLGELFIITSVLRVHESDWSKDGVRFYRARDIVSIFNNEVFEPLHISRELYERFSKKCGKIEAGNLLVTGVGTIGIPYLVKAKDEFYFKDGNIIWLKNSVLNGEFLYYSFQSKPIVEQIKASSGLGTVGTYTIESANRTLIRYPSYKSQEKIGRFLSLIDLRIQTQNKIIEEKEKLIYAINDYLYDKSPKQEYKLLSLFEQYGGLSGKTADDFGKGMPYITFLSVLNDTYVTREHTQLVDIKKEEKQNIVGYGDVVLTLSSETPEEVGIAAVNLIAEPVYLNSFCMGLKNKNKNIVYNDYLTWLFSTKKFRKHIFPYAQGSTRFNLNVSSFMNSYFELPLLDNQIKITKMLNESLRELEIEKAILSKYILQRKYLLRNLFI